jgi:hypothetical protein
MAVHELVTNASKHGSLTDPAGRVDLNWSVTRTQQGLTLVLDWKESGGPPPKRSRRSGFGSRLINMVIERQLNGQVDQSFGPQGLEARLTVPLTHERWPEVMNHMWESVDVCAGTKVSREAPNYAPYASEQAEQKDRTGARSVCWSSAATSSARIFRSTHGQRWAK